MLSQSRAGMLRVVLYPVIGATTVTPGRAPPAVASCAVVRLQPLLDGWQSPMFGLGVFSFVAAPPHHRLPVRAPPAGGNPLADPRPGLVVAQPPGRFTVASPSIMYVESPP